MSAKQNILKLLDRPKEPIFMPKTESKTVFDVPASYLVSIMKYNLIDYLCVFRHMLKHILSY